LKVNSPRNTTLNKINTTIGLFTQANNYRKTIQTWWVDRNTYSISITAKEPFYMDVREWLMTLIPQVSQRSISLVTVRGNRLAMVHDSNKQQVVNFKGHRIGITVIKAPQTFAELLEASSNSLAHGNEPREEQVIFTCFSLEGQKLILETLRNLQQENSNKVKKAQIKTFGRWGDWTNYQELPHRSLDSVVLAEGQMERIVNDMQTFLDSEDEYVRRGIPYHRGYLFEGPPGTGKSSLAKVLAAHFNTDLWYLPLGSVKTDLTLMSVINSVTPKSILLLEDVDVFSGMRNRDDEGEGFTMSGLLNTLDGVATPHGIIIILTTNDASVLDPAIKRPGRVDLEEELGYLEEGQAERMFEIFYQRPPRQPLGLVGYTPGAVMNVFKQHMTDPDAAERACLNGQVREWTDVDERAEALLSQGAAAFEEGGATIHAQQDQSVGHCS
jgi:ATP-dependent 26S proteasome regulatory subunit